MVKTARHLLGGNIYNTIRFLINIEKAEYQSLIGSTTSKQTVPKLKHAIS